MPRVAVLGGGISGLAAANCLHELAASSGTGIEIVVFEAGERAGGCIQTIERGGFLMELGPDSLIVQKPAIASLLDRLGLADRIVSTPETYARALIVHNARLRPIPEGFRLFAPRSMPALARSGIFSLAGLARAALEPFVPARAADDETLASFVTRRFGREVLDRLAQPLIGGIYSGDPERLSMAATLPQFLEYEREFGSVLRGLQRAPKAAAVRLVSLARGLGEITAALLARLQRSIRASSPVGRLTRDSAWRVGAGSDEPAFDAVICALPAPAAATVMGALDAPLADALRAIRCNSIATVNLAFDAAPGALPRATGFVVPAAEHREIVAATFSSQKYPARAPDGGMLARAFAGGAMQPEIVDRSDGELVAIASREFAELAGLRAEPAFSVVTRWKQALPEYGLHHAKRVSEIRARASAHSGLALAGCAYDGVGIPDCVASGEAAAKSVFGYICGA